MEGGGVLRSCGEPSALRLWRLLAWEGDTEKLFKDLNIWEGDLFFQPFWTAHADGDADGSSDASRLTDETMDAVAARFEMGMTKNVKPVAVYPAYVVVRGPSQDVSVPHHHESAFLA